MPTEHPRLNVVLEKPLYNSLRRLAKKDGVSLSLKARDLIREAMKLEEVPFRRSIGIFRKEFAKLLRKDCWLTHFIMENPFEAP